MKMNFCPCIIFVSLLVVVLFVNCGHTQLGPFPRQELDNRCFLNGGGSTLSFFVKESLPISSVVGRLDIQGDIESDIELLLGNTSQSFIEHKMFYLKYFDPFLNFNLEPYFLLF